MLKNVGAPKGGRVHWFCWLLEKEVWNQYRILYNYPEYKYLLLRYRNKTVIAVMIIIRTSKSTFRLSYFNVITKQSMYLSFKSAKKCAEWVNKFAIKELFNEKQAFLEQYKINLFAKRLRFLLRIQKKTQSELAKYLHISQQTVSKWIHKEYLPDEDKILKIIEFFNVDKSLFKEILEDN